MTKIDIQIHENVIDIFNKIKNIDDVGIEIDIPKGSIIFDNVLNIKLLKRICNRDGKELIITTQDKHGQNIIDIAEEKYIEESVNYINYENNNGLKNKLSIPKVNLSTLKFNLNLKNSIPKINLNKIALLIVPITIFAVGGAFYFGLNKMHKANVNIVVESQTLSRSITIQVIKDSSNDFDNSIIKGYEVQQSYSNEKEVETTGEKIEGEKAKGTITIYNRTPESKQFEKGEVLILEDDDEDYKFVLTEDVEVDKRIEDDTDPEEPMIPGEKEVEVEAVEIGDEYNFSKDKTLKFDDYDSSDFIAKNTTDIKGGKTETLKTVSNDDIQKLNELVTKENNEEVVKLLEENNTDDRNYIKGTQNIVIVSNDYSNEIDEESDIVSLEQRVTATGLAYSLDDLNNLVKNNIQNLVPEGFEIMEQDTQLNVEVLNSISTTNAEIQVTVRLFITPDIDPLELKDTLKGQTIEEVQESINSLSNIQTYQIYVYPNLSIFKKFPNDTNKIEVQIERE